MVNSLGIGGHTLMQSDARPFSHSPVSDWYQLGLRAGVVSSDFLG
jgi:hypothetical protein